MAIALWHLSNSNVLIGAISIFFALSGYFFALKIRRYQAEHKTLNLLTETPRLIWRLFSHLHIVILFVLVWIVWRGSEAARSDWLDSALMMSFGWGNWFQINQATDYFSRDSLLSPYFHMWAISAQFQLMVLLLIAGFVLTIIKIKIPTFLKRISLFILIAVTCYLIYFDITLYVQSTEYHLSTWNWLWAILFGVTLAYIDKVLPRNTLVNVITDAAFIFIVGLVILGLFGITPLGSHLKDAILLLVAIPILTTPGSTFVSRMLCTSIFQQLGTLSFGVFLWHWPLMIIVKNELNVEALNIIEVALILLLSFGLSYFSTNVVARLTSCYETRSIGRSVVLKIASLSLAPVVIFVLSQIGNQSVLPEPTDGQLPSLKPALTQVLADLPDYVNDPRCELNSSECIYGDEDAGTYVILYGSSLAANWQPALSAVAESEGWKLEVRINEGCPSVVESESCDKWLERNAKYILNAKPDLVLTNFSMIVGVPPQPAGEGVNPDIFRLPDFAEARIPFAVLRGPTFYPGRPLECLQRSANYVADCSFAKDSAYLPFGEVKRITQQLGNALDIIDLTEIFCPNEVCLAADTDGHVIYRDTRHITRTYSLLLVGPLTEALKERLGD